MSEVMDLAAVRRVEEQLLQKRPGYSQPDLTNLVAIFTRRDNGSWLPVFNVEEIDDLPGFPQCLSLKQLAEDKRDVLAEYNGIVITFEALGLLRPDIVTRGPRFYPMEQFYRNLHGLEKLPQTQWKLAKTLFSALLKKGEFQERPAAYLAGTWLKKMSRVFRLTLPALLERFPVDGLLAVVPDENFIDYLEKLQGSLIYVTANGLLAAKESLLDLEHFSEVTTDIQLCAAFSEVVFFNERINPKAAGFVDLRKELRSGLHAIDFSCVQKRAEDIKTTITRLALLYNQRSQTDNNMAHPLKTLNIESWLADQELDEIVGIALSQSQTTDPSPAPLCSYYLTLPESSPETVISIDDLLNGTSEAAAHSATTSLRSLRRLFSRGEDSWLPLSDVMLRLDRPQALARSSYLTSRWLFTMQDAPIDMESIADEAAVACYVYSLAEPYYYYWPHGDHEHHLLQSYKNFHEQLDELVKNVVDTKGKNYYHSLKIWWNYREGSFKQRKKMPEEALKELDSIRRSESIRQYPAASSLYELFSALLTMFTRTWQPGETRERLLKAGYDQVASDSIVKPWDVFDLQLDLKQPSPLFFAELREFLALSEKSHLIRIEVDESPLKAKQLCEIGSRLGQHIGLNFEKYVSRYREASLRAQTVGEREGAYEVREEASERESDLNELDDSLLLPMHERIWMKSLYYSAIVDHAALIHALEGKPVQSKIFPREVTQYVSTVIRISLAGASQEKFENSMEVEIVLLVSEDYDIQEQVVRKKFEATQPVEFTVAFRKTGNVPLLFEYIVDKKRHYADEAWIHVIELEPQVRWINNPYQYGTEIINPQNHYGRRQELEMILNHLRAMSKGSERQNFRLRGMRRSGKTSLLIMIRKVIEDTETRRYYRIPEEIDATLNTWHPVFYSLQGLSNESNNKKVLDSKVFFMSLTKAICKSLHWVEQATDDILSRIEADFARLGDIVGAVEAQLERILDELRPDQHILILLDEVDLLGSENEIRLFGQLRTLITSPELTHIAWILTSRRALQAPGEGLESPLHNIFAPVLLKNLDVMEARRLVLEPARKEKIYFEPEAVASILQQTGCQPFMLQVICSVLVDQLKILQTSYASKGLTDRTITQLLEPGTAIQDQCQFLWDQASASSRNILALLARSEQGMSKRELVERFQANIPPGQSDPYRLFNDAWEDLLASDLVSHEQGGICQLKIPIFRQWLARRDTNF